VWALDSSLPIALEEQVCALAEGAVIGGYDGRRWRSGESSRAVERFVICGCPHGVRSAANRAALVASWTNTARELVDSPANLMSPADLSDRVVKFAHLDSEIVDPVRAGLGALVAVGECSPIPSRHLSSAIGREARPVTGSARWSSWPRG
jgi:leucyl aminopeptidase